MSSQDGQDICSFEGNNDIYGQGIRAGVYLQAASIATATLFGQKAILNKISYGSGIFQFALTVGLCILTTTSSDFRAVEAALVVLLAICSSFQAPSPGSNMFLHRPWTLDKVQSWVQDAGLPLFRNGVEMILLCYSVWFWFRGLDVLPHSEACTTYAFFFSRVDLYGWFRTLGKVYIILELVSQVVVFVFWMKSRSSNKTPEDALPQVEAQMQDAPEQTPESFRDIYKKAWHLFFGFNRFMLLTFIALSVELMIRWNNVTSVSSLKNVGQLIALLVGVGGFVSVVLEWEHGDPSATASS